MREAGTSREQAAWKAPQDAASTKASERVRTMITGYEKTRLPDGRLELRANDGSVFYGKELREAGDPAIERVQMLLKNTFGEDEVDDMSVRQQAVEYMKLPIEYRVYGDIILQTVEDKDGNVAGMQEGCYMPVRSDGGESKGYGVLMTGYIVAEQNARDKHLGNPMLEMMMEQGQKYAQERKEDVRFLAGECVPRIEILANRRGINRIYLEKADGSLEEFRYLQPPLEWNPKTGEPLSEKAAEHFMIGDAKDPNNRQLSPQDVLDCVKSFYTYVYEGSWPRDAFENEEAFLKSRAYVATMFNEARAQLADARSINLVSKLERQVRQKAGRNIIEHAAADNKDWKESGQG